MNLLTEPSTVFAPAAPKQPVRVWRLFVQRFAAEQAAQWTLKMALALAVAGVITACGPGTGGTGVGPVAGTYVSLSATTTGASTASGTPQPGTGQPGFQPGDYALTLEPRAIRLTGACLDFQFDGAWAENNGEIRVTGSYRQAAPGNDLTLAPALPGLLVARVESTGLTVALQDARGAVVLSFATGARVADGVAVVPAPACKSLSTSSL